MKAHLMYRDADFDPNAALPPGSADVEQDLELGYLFGTMADRDEFLRTSARTALLRPLASPESISYRQEALEDCFRSTERIDALYALTVRALETQRGVLFFLLNNSRPGMLLSRAVSILRLLMPIIGELRQWCTAAGPELHSEAFRCFVATVQENLDETYLQRLRDTIRLLELRDGVLMSAAPGAGGEVTGQVLRRPREENRRLLSRNPLKRPSFAFTIPERDEAGHNALAELQDRSLNGVANAASQAVDHVLAFFTSLRAELAFYLGAVRLGRRLSELGVPLATPIPRGLSAPALQATGVCDPCLALRTGARPVGNDVALGDRRVLVVTGANHGGKSTFLRSLGVAQLMMQAGLFVAARSFTSTIAGAVFTHWNREEDPDLVHGKLDEELARMSTIVDAIRPGDLLLANESFSSTNEAEGSDIARQVFGALTRVGVRVHLVTHLYDLASSLQRELGDDAAFLRAPRTGEDGPTYRLEEGGPLATSYGIDLFDMAFGTTLAEEPDRAETADDEPMGRPA